MNDFIIYYSSLSSSLATSVDVGINGDDDDLSLCLTSDPENENELTNSPSFRQIDRERKSHPPTQRWWWRCATNRFPLIFSIHIFPSWHFGFGSEVQTSVKRCAQNISQDIAVSQLSHSIQRIHQNGQVSSIQRLDVSATHTFNLVFSRHFCQLCFRCQSISSIEMAKRKTKIVYLLSLASPVALVHSGRPSVVALVVAKTCGCMFIAHVYI